MIVEASVSPSHQQFASNFPLCSYCRTIPSLAKTPSAMPAWEIASRAYSTNDDLAPKLELPVKQCWWSDIEELNVAVQT